MSNKIPSGIRQNQADPSETNAASLPPVTRNLRLLETTQDSLRLKGALNEPNLQKLNGPKEKNTLVTDLLARQSHFKEKLKNGKLLNGPIEKADQARLDDAKKLDSIEPMIEKRESDLPQEIDPELVRTFTLLHDQLRSSPVIFPKGRKT